MIKALGTIGNRRTLLLGLSRENTNRLHDDQPIAVDVQALLATVADYTDVQDVILFAGETEQDMADRLRQVGLIRGEQPPA